VEAFQNCPQLELQTLTTGDIRKYIQGKLGSKRGLENPRYLQLVEIMIGKASGVFLWVVLATKSICEGLRNGDTFNELLQRTEKLPSDLKELFAHMLQKIPRSYKKQSASILSLALASLDIEHRRGHPVLALQLSVADETWEKIKSADITEMCEATERQCWRQYEARLRSRCCGLLEYYMPRPSQTSTTYIRPVVQFIHKTAVEFLKRRT
jgi:hypothetical protein